MVRRRCRSPRYLLIEKSGLAFRKSETDTEGERWTLPPVWLDLANSGPRGVCLKSLYVRPSKRGQGHAGMVLSALCRAADEAGLMLTLSAHAYGDKFGPSTAKLVKWYARYGFVVRRVESLTGWIGMFRRPGRRVSRVRLAA